MDRSSAIRNVLIATLLANTLVAAAKVVYGSISNSIAMTSDGFHSIFDGLSNVVGLIGIWIASRPPDRSHPYGHRKYETLFTIGISFMIFLTGFQILRRVIESFGKDHGVSVTPASFGIMLVTMTVNLGVFLYESRRGRELGSEFLIADAKHTKSDILTSLSVIAGLLFTRFGYARADAIVGVFIALLIARIGYGILRSASDALVDTVCIDTFAVEETVNRVAGVRSCHDIRTRGTAHSIFLDLHVLVDPALSIAEGHRIADSVETAIKERFPAVVDIVVHVEPEEQRG